MISNCRLIGVTCGRVTRAVSSSAFMQVGGIGDSNAGVVSGVEDAAEAKIARWLKEGGADNLKGKAYVPDRHKDAATALGKGMDYQHTKILADNNFLPQSVELRKELDTKWETLRQEIRESHSVVGRPSIQEFVHSPACEGYRQKIASLDAMAKKVNEAIISDSLRFNGLSPVKHAKRFEFKARVEEALE